MKQNFRSTIGCYQNDSAILSAAALSPDEVLHHPELTKAEKRAILAVWASDVRAVEGDPALRQLHSGELVDVGDILRALQALDDGNAAETTSGRVPSYPRRQRLLQAARWGWRRPGRKNGPDDDNNQPPPCPAAAYPRSKPSMGFGNRCPEWA